jgi:hypothetical protein
MSLGRGHRPARAGSIWLLGALLTASSALAESRFTLPLPAQDLPDGTLTVKVVGKDLRDLKVGQPVVLVRRKGDAAEALKQAKTGEDGRARFQGLSASERYEVVVTAGEQEHRSKPFAGPTRGGVRLLLSLGGARMGAASERGMPPGHPPLTGAPAKEPQGGAARFEDAPDLKPGQLLVQVLKGDKDPKPLGGARVVVSKVQGPDGAKAQGRQEPRRLETDEQGQALLTLEATGPERYQVQVTHDKLTYHGRKVALPAEHGLKATFVVYDRTGDRSRLALGGGSHWVCQLGERVVRVMQIIEIEHRAQTIFDPGADGLEIPLPAGAADLEIPAELSSVLVPLPEPRRDAVRLVAPVPPVGVQLRVFYTLPYRGRELELRQPMALALPESRIVLMNGAEVQLSGPSLAGPGQKNPDGPGVVYPLGAIAAGARVELTLAGLPHRDRGMLLGALVLCGLIALWGLAAALTGRQRAEQRRLRREQLIGQLVDARRSSAGRQGGPGRQEEIARELSQIWEEPW